MVLAKAVSLVEGALVPRDVELPLLHSVMCPAESQVHSLGSFLLDEVACDASGRIAIGFDDGRRLWVAHFLKHCSGSACFFAVVFLQSSMRSWVTAAQGGLLVILASGP
jgi:hypothetical protein